MARRLWKSGQARFGAALILLLVLAALLAPWLAPADPNAQQLVHRYAPPLTHGFLLGSDDFGRDLLSRVLYGARVSLTVGVASVLAAALAGLLVGATAGFLGGVTDVVIVRVIDLFLMFPVILLALLMVATVGPGTGNIIFAIAVANAPRFARVARASALGVARMEFVTAAVSSGASRVAILFRHIIPNIVSPVLVMASLSVGSAILTETGLSFLGLGIQPPTPTWGGIVRSGAQVLDHAPWVALAGGLPIMLAILGFNLFGDALRDAIDAKTMR